MVHMEELYQSDGMFSNIIVEEAFSKLFDEIRHFKSEFSAVWTCRWTSELQGFYNQLHQICTWIQHACLID